jgi:transcriptional regulator with XRE-family HTH domain
LKQWRRRVSIGDSLAAARRQAGLTITQVSQRTCIRETIIRGIERGDYSACGGDFYARGHIRSIARAVGLDPEELVREYDTTHAAPKQITAADVFQPFTPVRLKERRRPNWSLLLAAALIVVLGVAGFKYFSARGNSGPSHLAASTHTNQHSAKPKPSTQPVVLTPPNHVRITLVAAPGRVTWTLLTSVSGAVIFMGDVGQPNGPQRKSWLLTHPAVLRLGNPPAAELWLNGKRVALTSINPVTLTCTRYGCH